MRKAWGEWEGMSVHSEVEENLSAISLEGFNPTMTLSEGLSRYPACDVISNV